MGFSPLPSPAQAICVIFIFLVASFHGVAASQAQGPGPKTFNVVEYGAVGNGKTYDTQAFLKSWSALCRTTGAVKWLIPSGKTFLVGPTYFNGSCVADYIHVQILGNIVAPSSPSQWKGSDTLHWLAFYRVQNLVIDGTATIDGKGSRWWDCKLRSDKSCSKAPSAFEIIQCQHVSLSGLTFLNSQGVHVKIVFSQYVTVSNIKIIAPDESPNTDGINLGASQYVQIHDCSIKTGDDCISMLKGSKYVNISRIACGPGHGISIGSLGKYGSNDSVELINVREVNFTGTQNGARIKTWQGGRGFVRNVVFSRLRFSKARNPIIIDQFYCPGRDNCPTYKDAVKISDVSFIGASGTTTSDVAINLKCSNTVPCTNILLQSVNLLPADPRQKTRAFCHNTHGSSSRVVFPRVPCLFKEEQLKQNPGGLPPPV